ncbi:MAG: ATP-grasp domain-containing protein [Leptospiraceae bacterium]|nr:ATP-grasp domain-containing protein [Leptospiraceae bacterium]
MQIQGKKASADQDYFLSLGAGHHQVPLIEAARQKGLAVIAVDRNPLAPGFQLADLQLHSSILKPFWIYRAIEEHFPRGRIVAVGSRSFGPAVLSASYLARRFSAPGSSPHSIIRFQDKNRLKSFLGSHGVAVPERVGWKPGKDPADVLRKRGIWIARSGKGSAKQGIEVLSTLEEKRAYLEKHSRRTPENRSLFIEKYYQGTEFIAYGIVLNGNFHALTLTEKIVSDTPPRFADRRHLFPARTSEENARTMVRTCQRIVDLCRYDNGPFFAEFLVPSRGKNRSPLLIECQPEVGGECLADALVPDTLDIDYFAMLVDLLTDGPTRASLHLTSAGISLDRDDLSHILKPSRSAVISYLLPDRATIKDLRMPLSMQEDPAYVFLKPLKPVGYTMDPLRGNADRPAVFFLKDSIEHQQELIHKAEHFEKQIRLVPEPEKNSKKPGRRAARRKKQPGSLALSVSLWKPLI